MTTFVSIDGAGAYDSISRKAMLEALVSMPGGSAVLPFVRLFYGQPSRYLWEDEDEAIHHIHQGEGGEALTHAPGGPTPGSPTPGVSATPEPSTTKNYSSSRAPQKTP